MLTGYASANTGGEDAAASGRGDTTPADPDPCTEADHLSGPEEERCMPLLDPPKRYGTSSGFQLQRPIALILVGVSIAWIAL